MTPLRAATVRPRALPYLSRWVRVSARPRVLLFAVGFVSLSGCGGGDGGTAPPSQPPPPAVTAVNVTPTTATLQGIGATLSVTAAVVPATASASPTWTSDNSAVATVIGSGTSATITAVAAGTTQIRASAGGVQGAVSITVNPIVRGVTLSTDSISLVVARTATLVATVSADASASTALTWSSSAPTVATVSDAGVVTGVAPGIAVVTVASVANPALTATANVNVSYPTVRALIISPDSLNLLLNASQQLAASVDADSGTSLAVSWTTSAAAIATVSATGLVTAVAPGSATVTATSAANPLRSAAIPVVVRAPTVRAIGLSPSVAALFAGNAQQYTAAIEADPGVSTAVTWSSSVPSIATVSTTGLVTAIAPGTTLLRVQSNAVPTVSASLTLTVSPRPAVSQWTTSAFGLGSIYTWTRLEMWSVRSDLAFAADPSSFSSNFYQWNGAQWQPNNALIPFDQPSAVGGFGTDVYVGSMTGRIARLQLTNPSNTFVEMAVPATGRIIKIVGTGDGGAIALGGAPGLFGSGADVLVLKNGSWTKLPATGLSQTRDIAAQPGSPLWDTNIIAVGLGTPGVRRWSGVAWVGLGSPGFTDIPTAVAVHGAEVVVSAEPAASARLSNGVWSPITVPAPRPNSGSEFITNLVHCGGSLYTGTTFGGRVLQLNGPAWNVDATYGEALPGSYETRVSCGSDNVLRVSGASGAIARRTASGYVWEHASPFLSRAVVLRRDLAYAAGGNGMVLRWNGSSWAVEHSASSFGNFNALAATSDGLVLTAGAGRPTGLWRRSNGTWSFDALPASVSALYASSASHALALGFSSAYQFNGASWQSIPLPEEMSPFSMDGSGPDFVIAVGQRFGTVGVGRIVHWDGVSWSVMALPQGSGVINKVQVLSPTLAFAAAQNGVLRWDGATWSFMASLPAIGTDLPLRSVAATSASDVYALGGSGTVFHFDGSTWTRQGVLNAPTMSSIPRFSDISVGDGAGIVVGAGATILQGSVPMAMRRR